MDQSTAFMDLKYRLGFSAADARDLLDRATAETVATFGPSARLYCYRESGALRFKLAGVA